MNKAFYLSMAIVLAALAQDCHAGLIGDWVTATSFEITDLNPSPEQIRDSYINGVFDPEFDGSIMVGTNTFTMEFDFQDDVLEILVSYDQSGLVSAPDFSITFSSLDWTVPNETLIDAIVTNDSPPFGEDLEQGFLAEIIDPHTLVLSFSGFKMSDSRSIQLSLITVPTTTTENPPVVPVPAAAPMALLGLGVLALARRLRRKTS